MTRLLIEVTDRFGTVREIVDTEELAAMPRRKRAVLNELAAKLIAELTPVFGFERTARAFAVSELARLVADEAAYERVAARRGMLPL